MKMGKTLPNTKPQNNQFGVFTTQSLQFSLANIESKNAM